MTGPTPRQHPEPEILAAFLESNLSGAELDTIADHLRGCEECREILGEAASFEQEEAQTATTPKRGRLVRWPWVAGLAAAAVIVTVVGIPWIRGFAPGGRSIQNLITSSPKDTRNVEPRLSGGFGWAPLARVMRGPEDRPSARLLLADAEIQTALKKRRTAKALHAAAVADMLLGRSDAAVDKLREASTLSGSDAQIWSDLSAACWVRGREQSSVETLEESLRAADRALEIEPDHREAIFNKALALEALSRSDQATAAWNAYLAIDAGSGWAREAREHISRLPHRETH